MRRAGTVLPSSFSKSTTPYYIIIDLLFYYRSIMYMKKAVREETALFSVKGQIVIPSRLRKEYRGKDLLKALAEEKKAERER